MAHSFVELDKAVVHVIRLVAAAAKSLQSCPTPCDPIDGSPPDHTGPSSHPGARLEASPAYEGQADMGV